MPATRSCLRHRLILSAVAAASLLLIGVVPARAAASPCASRQLAATFSLIPGSQGAGQIGYTLTITNRGPGGCTLAGTPALRLLGAHGQGLPSSARTYPGGSYLVALAAGQWAQAAATFTPDIAASNEPGNRCEPVAQALRVSLPDAGGALVAPMDPTMVCQHGRMAISRLKAVPRTAPCRAGSLAGAFSALGPPYAGGVIYALTLTNRGALACVVLGTPRLTLLSADGHAIPTRVQAPVSYPYVIAPGRRATLDANAFTARGAGEPSGGACEPVARYLAVSLPQAGGSIRTAVSPARSLCHRGLLAVSGLFLNG